MIDLFIPHNLVYVQSQNQSTYSHWTKYKRYKDRWWRVLHRLLHGQVPEQPWPFAVVTITRVYGPRCRPYDYANLVGGCKPIPDALIKIGVLTDDDPKHFEATYHQRRFDEDQPPGTIITIREVR